MTSSGIKGEISCEQDVKFVWKIEKFSSLSENVDHYYASPLFNFCGRSWHLRLYLKGKSCYHSEYFIGLFLVPMESGSMLEIRYSLGIKGANGETEVWTSGKNNFTKRRCGFGEGRCILRSELLQRKEELVPLNVCTLTATLKIGKEEASMKGTEDVAVQTTVEVNLEDENKEDALQKTGSEKVVQDMRRLLRSGDNSDVVIKVGDVEFKAHRAILGIRTPVLSAMFKHDTVENKCGEVTIEDCEPAAFEQLLHFIYTGALRVLNSENASALYAVADKYLVNEVKEMCVHCLRDTMCLTTFCDVVTLSLVHKEENLLEMAIDFFSENMVDVMKTVEWQRFMRDHLTWANEITIRALELEGRKENLKCPDVKPSHA